MAIGEGWYSPSAEDERDKTIAAHSQGLALGLTDAKGKGNDSDRSKEAPGALSQTGNGRAARGEECPTQEETGGTAAKGNSGTATGKAAAPGQPTVVACGAAIAGGYAIIDGASRVISGVADIGNANDETWKPESANYLKNGYKAVLGDETGAVVYEAAGVIATDGAAVLSQAARMMPRAEEPTQPRVPKNSAQAAATAAEFDDGFLYEGAAQSRAATTPKAQVVLTLGGNAKPAKATTPGAFISWVNGVGEKLKNTGQTPTPSELNAVVDEAQGLGLNVQLDGPHGPDNPWNIPHLHVLGDQGGRAHVPTPAGYQLPLP